MVFFDKVGEKASEMYNSTAEKTNKLTKEMKLKSAISDNKNKITKAYQEIGEIIYNKYSNNEEIDVQDSVGENLKQIDSYQKEIVGAQAEIRSLKELKLCEKCKKEINKAAKFCPLCGSNQTSSKQEEPIEVEGKQIDEETIEGKIEENQAVEQALLNDNSKREPNIDLPIEPIE